MEGSRIEERPATLGARLRLRVPPDPQLGRYVREQIIAFASALDIPEADLGDFLTALGEALANAMEHSGAREPIEVSVWLVGSDQLVATVVDRGVGFEPSATAASEPHLPDSLSERGRGLPIMRRCSDIFSVRSAPGQGTAVTLGRFVNRESDRLRFAAG
jgi:stage II sporulation protein AB (anti-sigma F factor)